MYSEVQNDSRLDILTCHHISSDNKEQYSVKSRSTTKDQNLINQLKSQIKKEFKHWHSTYYLSDKLIENQEFPRESNNKYLWKKFDDKTEIYISTELSKEAFHKELKNSSSEEDELMKIEIEVFEYEFKDNSEFNSFKYRRYEFDNGTFHDALICSKHTDNRIENIKNEIEDEINEIKKRHPQLQKTRSVIVEWIFRNFGSSNEEFKIPTYDTYVMDLLDSQNDKMIQVYKRVEELKQTIDDKKLQVMKQMAKEIQRQVDWDQIEKYDVGL